MEDLSERKSAFKDFFKVSWDKEGWKTEFPRLFAYLSAFYLLGVGEKMPFYNYTLTGSAFCLWYLTKPSTKEKEKIQIYVLIIVWTLFVKFFAIYHS